MKPAASPFDIDRLEDELDQIIRSEINRRLPLRPEIKNPNRVGESLEDRMAEIVRAHENETLMAIIPTLFAVSLQILARGALFFDRDDLPFRDFLLYEDQISRVRALTAASLTHLPQHILDIFDSKMKRFDQAFALLEKNREYIREIDKIREDAEQMELQYIRDEEDAVAFYKAAGTLRTRLVSIESVHTELKSAPFLEQGAANMQNAMHLATKSLTARTEKPARFLFSQAAAVYRQFQMTRVHLTGMEQFIRQKEELARYHKLFSETKDMTRAKKTAEFITSIDKTIDKLNRDIDREKTGEAASSQKENLKIQESWNRFQEIRKQYENGGITTVRQEKKASSVLNKCLSMLKSSGQRVKAREVERFLNVTGLGKGPLIKNPLIKNPHTKKKAADETLYAEYLFYKRAFFILLPVAMGLLFLVVLQII